jgi:hypothetical protein
MENLAAGLERPYDHGFTYYSAISELATNQPQLAFGDWISPMDSSLSGSSQAGASEGILWP